VTKNASQYSVPIKQFHSCYSIFKAVKLRVQVANPDLWLHVQDKYMRKVRVLQVTKGEQCTCVYPDLRYH